MPTLNFTVVKKKKPQIYAILRGSDIGVTQKFIFTGHTIEDVSLWDKKKQRVKTSKDSTAINKKLIDWEGRYENYISKCKNYNQHPNLAEILALFESDAPQVNKNSLINAIELYIKDHKATLKGSSKTKYTNLITNVKDYEKIHGTVHLGLVNLDFYNNFIEFLISIDNQNKTISRKLTSIKTVMRYASIAKDLTANTKWMVTVPLRDADSHREPLKKEEITALYNFKTSDEVAMKYIDAFVVAIFTGLRYSDLIQLTDDSIKFDDGYHLGFYSQKTGSWVDVPLPEFLVPRLTKYKGRFFDWNDDSIMMNNCLKEVCEELGFTRNIQIIRFKGTKREVQIKALHEVISCHWARYTYIHILDTLKIQATYIQDNVGHSDLKTTNGYLQTDTNNRIKETNNALNQYILKAV